jgi:hypothetical protein
MPWHSFLPGRTYQKSMVIAECENHLKNVKNPWEKSERIKLIRECSYETIVYSPIGSGWGNSPLNPNCWKSIEGKQICEQLTIPRYPAP